MFTEKLRELRRSLKLTQKEMAERLAMDQSTYSRRERDNAPKPPFLERIRKFLGVDPTPWLTEDEPAQPGAESDSIRIIHMEQPPAAGKEPQPNGGLSKRDEKALHELISLGLRYFKLKLNAQKQARKRVEDSPGGGNSLIAMPLQQRRIPSRARWSATTSSGRTT
jgi:transcriptional regulator with XRE-family HTH domain